MAREEREAMTSERLAEINSLTADVVAGQIHVRFDEETAWLAILDLRREVERRRAREAALAALAREVADGDVYHDSKGGMLVVAAPDALLAKARALLAGEGSSYD